MNDTRSASPEDFRTTAWRLVELFRPFRGLLGVAALGIGSIVLNVAGPLLLGRATNLVLAGVIGQRYPTRLTKAQAIEQLRQDGDHVLATLATTVDFQPGHGVDFQALTLVLVAALVAYVNSGLLWILQGRFTTGLIQHTIFRLRERVPDKLARLPMAYFDRQPRGEILSRTTNDIDNIAQGMQQTISQITNSALLLIGVLGVMFWISPLLSLVALVAAPLSIYVTKVLGERAQRQFARQWELTGAVNTHIDEAYSGYLLVRMFGRQRESMDRFREQNEQLFLASARAQAASGAIGPLTTIIGNLTYVLVAVIGGFRLASGALSVGSIQAFIQYSRQFTQPLMAVANLANRVQSAVASARRVFDFLDTAEESPSTSPGVRPRHEHGRVGFESVSFRYEPDKPLIEDVTFTVEPGQLVAIVGPTGAGKTTLVNLLMRYYDVTGGRITVDGVDIRTMDRDELRSRIGLVLQDTWLFGGTISDNIAYGRTAASHAEILEAARAAHVDHFIRTLSEGYDTLVDSEGGGVSAGERQLITIARAILANPLILVLDEATSSVDTRTELLVQQATARLSAGRTTFVIAHRLATIRGADLIMMMMDGRIVEQGTQDELLAAGGPYARLYAAQFTSHSSKPTAIPASSARSDKPPDLR